MALPVWVVPAAKVVGKWAITNGPQLVDLAKRYGPPALRAYKQHGFKVAAIVSSVRSDMANGAQEPAQVAAKTSRKKRARRSS